MYIQRTAEQLINRYLKVFPVVAVMGPRQSGKSTMLLHELSKDYAYVNFDNFETISLFRNDPRRFLEQYDSNTIFDEVQRVPEIFPMLKEAVDKERQKNGRFILTGSGQFLLGKNISESLAGRIGIIQLMPMQSCEIPHGMQPLPVYKGSYPELVINSYAESQAWYNSYLMTYVQKDLRQFINITDLHAFTLFLKYLAANCSRILNLSAASRDIGITVSTLGKWLSVLEESYIVFRLQPFYRNIGKRLIKSPKVYFMDTGLLAYLTGIESCDQWENGIMYGAIFENYVVSELLKMKFHHGLNMEMYFLKTSHNDEIDVVINSGRQTRLVEIKASVTYRPVFHKMLDKLEMDEASKQVVYRGDSFNVLPGIKAWNYMDFLNDEKNVRLV